jgi:methionyl-tRNA formyltransferase
VTLHRIDLKLDAGPIIEQSFGDMSDARTVLAVAARMTDHVSPMLRRFFDSGARITNVTPQNPAGRTYFGHPTRADVRRLRADGRRMMDASSHTDLFDRVRALCGRVPRFATSGDVAAAALTASSADGGPTARAPGIATPPARTGR